MDFGTVLRKARIGAGLSQEEMAPQMFMPRSTISKLENDKMELKASDLIRWFQVTQVPEAAVALICGVDVVAVTQLITTLLGGFIHFI
ncbi:helix-turn-helix transcriptional regulator [Sporosarcina sp. FSL K6-6792]|uniref:helix-turn-helix domain-containing protein n=1 Tax=Sporosarcina sp. FSL K6-6792 TaxID=2921559 RepID=UPI0030F640F1